LLISPAWSALRRSGAILAERTRMTGNSPRLDLGPAKDRPSSPSLPPELAHEATRRLELLALVYAIGSIIEHVGHRALLGISGRSGAVGLSGLLSGTADYGLGDALLLAAVAMGVAMWAISRFGRLSPNRLLDLGLVFQVAGALGIAAIRFAEAGPIRPDTAFGLVPSECIWIVAYPLVVPSVPRKALIGSLLAASAGPALLVTSATLRGTTVDRPLESAIYYVLSTYFSAISAYIVARIVHGYSMRLKHARDIGSYELIELLGEGGMGQVWRARHRLLARPAAIKLIRGDVLGANGRSRDALVRRFEREAQDTAMLGSPHTIDVYDFGVTEDGNFYYVMELLDGLNLER
jgi:serine/threonine-protein kinase